MSKQVYGYIRVSTQEQSADRQHIALLPFKIPKRNLYVDVQSGKSFDRPAYQKLIRRLECGDLLIIASIDRLGRNYGEIIEQWRIITKMKGADIRVLDMPLLDTTYYKDLLGTFISDLVLQVLSFAAQLERDNMLQRQAAGIAAAHSRGVVFGRKSLPLPTDFASLVSLWRDGRLSADEAAASCGFSLRTLYNRTKNMR